MDSHGLSGILGGIDLSLGHEAWNSRHVGQFVTVSDMSTFMLTN